jgi:hypothetical protein
LSVVFGRKFVRNSSETICSNTFRPKSSFIKSIPEAAQGRGCVGKKAEKVVREPADGHHDKVVEGGQQRLQEEVGSRMENAFQDYPAGQVF